MYMVSHAKAEEWLLDSHTSLTHSSTHRYRNYMCTLEVRSGNPGELSLRYHCHPSKSGYDVKYQWLRCLGLGSQGEEG